MIQQLGLIIYDVEQHLASIIETSMQRELHDLIIEGIIEPTIDHENVFAPGGHYEEITHADNIAVVCEAYDEARVDPYQSGTGKWQKVTGVIPIATKVFFDFHSMPVMKHPRMSRELIEAEIYNAYAHYYGCAMMNALAKAAIHHEAITHVQVTSFLAGPEGEDQRLEGVSRIKWNIKFEASLPMDSRIAAGGGGLT